MESTINTYYTQGLEERYGFDFTEIKFQKGAQRGEWIGIEFEFGTRWQARNRLPQWKVDKYVVLMVLRFCS
eukprot:SAG11_NODE_1229_length_5462_cov_12.053888_7_plen_71_part_00